MKTKKRFIIGLLTCALFLFSGCVLLDTDRPGSEIYFAAYTKYDAGEVEKKGETQSVRVGKTATLRAIDTEDYAFSHWEYLNEIVSNDREFVLKPKPTENSLDFRRYYAVFTPKDPTKALVNVLCDNGATIDEDLIRLDRLQVSGGGYYTIGEAATLQSTRDGVGIARTFTYENTIVDGPILKLSVQKNITVTATLEKMVEITVAENERCKLTLQSEDRFIEEYGHYQVEMEMTDDEYVPDSWQIKDLATDKVLEEWHWEENTTLEEVITSREISLYRRLIIDLTCTNENIMDTPLVDIISSTGDPVQIAVEKPAKMIRGRGFPMWVTPDENTYIQEIYETAPATEEFPFPSRINFRGVEDIYATGGEVFVPDSSEVFGDGCKVEMKAIPKAKAALVNIISDDDYIKEDCEKTGKKPSGYYSAALSTSFLVVEKNKEQFFQFDHHDHHENLYAIYEVGFQFSRIEDEDRRTVADNLEFLFTVSEDTNYYIKWEKKPVFDLYFDYTLTADKTGYAAKLSQLALFGTTCPNVEEISLPYSYNGKPVKEIADYGMSAYRCYPEKLGLEYYSYVPFDKIVLPYTIEKIGEKAFAGCFDLQVVLPQADAVSYISPDAFFSPNDMVSVNLSEKHLNMLLQTLHSAYIGENASFTYKIQDAAHFDSENTLAHYESLAEYVCIKDSTFTEEFSAFELGILYHEFFHHYQVVATTGLGEESLATMKIKPTSEEIESWKQPYDTTDYEKYWNHPMEVSAREFAEIWSGLNITLANG